MKKNPELERAIARAPDDADAHLVYADWLQAEGDPAGELIVLQQQRASAADLDAVESVAGAERRYLDSHWDDLLPGVPAASVGLRWRLGFVREAHYLVTQSDEATDELDALLGAPVARFLQAVGIEHRSYVSSDYQPLLETLATHRRLPLKALSIGTDRNSGRLGSLRVVHEAFADLEWLRVRGYSIDPDGLQLEKLRSLELRVRETDALVIEALRNAAWPQLEHLTLDLRGGQLIPDDIEGLLRDGRFPRLRHLALLSAAGLSNELCRVLSGSPIVNQLVTLDLSDGSMTQAGAEALAAGLGDASDLQLINLAENNLERAVAAFGNLAADVHYGVQNGAGRQNLGWKKPQRHAEAYNGPLGGHPSGEPVRSWLKTMARTDLRAAVRRFDDIPAYSRHRWGEGGRQTLLAFLSVLSEQDRQETVHRLCREAPPSARSQSVFAHQVLAEALAGDRGRALESANRWLALLSGSPHFSPRESLIRIFKKWLEGLAGDDSVLPSLERSLAWEPVAWRRFVLASLLQEREPERAAELLRAAYQRSMTVTPPLPPPRAARRLFDASRGCAKVLDDADVEAGPAS